MKNLKHIAVAAITAASLAACAAPTTTSTSSSTTTTEYDYATTSSTPIGYTDYQWDIIVEGAAEYGMPEYEAERWANIAYDVWNDGGEYDICSMKYSMSDDTFQDILIMSAYDEFGATGEGIVAGLATYALSINYC